MKKVIAIVGMAGSGKSDVASFLKEAGLPVVRLGVETDHGLEKQGLPNTEENARKFREDLRSELGMAAYATVAKPYIDEALLKKNTVILDGLYSWEEYQFLKEQYPELLVVCVFADRESRYERLKNRPVRPLEKEEAEKRDIAEIENLSKGGPIALADYILENNGTRKELQKKTEALSQKLGLA